MEDHRTTIVRQKPSLAATLALLLATLALILSWVAYNRTGKNLEDTISEKIKSTTQTGQQASDAVERGIDTGPDGVDDGAL